MLFRSQPRLALFSVRFSKYSQQLIADIRPAKNVISKSLCVVVALALSFDSEQAHKIKSISIMRRSFEK